MCCRASQWQGEKATLTLIVSGITTTSVEVTLNDRSVEMCEQLTVQVKHHQTIAKCDAMYGSGVQRKGASETLTLHVFKMTEPQITGPMTVKSGKEDSWTCTVAAVTYDNDDEFLLSWRVDGVANRNDRTTTSALGYEDVSRSRLSLHKVESRVSIVAPINAGANDTSFEIECLAWHVSLQQRGDTMKAIRTVLVQPEPTTITTVTSVSELPANGTSAKSTTDTTVATTTSATYSLTTTTEIRPKGETKWTLILKAVVGTLAAMIALTGLFYAYVQSREKKEKPSKKTNEAAVTDMDDIFRPLHVRPLCDVSEHSTRSPFRRDSTPIKSPPSFVHSEVISEEESTMVSDGGSWDTSSKEGTSQVPSDITYTEATSQISSSNPSKDDTSKKESSGIPTKNGTSEKSSGIQSKEEMSQKSSGIPSKEGTSQKSSGTPSKKDTSEESLDGFPKRKSSQV